MADQGKGDWNGSDEDKSDKGEDEGGGKKKLDPKDLPIDTSKVPTWKKEELLAQLLIEKESGWQDTGPTGGFVIKVSGDDTEPGAEAQAIIAEQRALEESLDSSTQPAATAQQSSSSLEQQQLGVAQAQPSSNWGMTRSGFVVNIPNAYPAGTPPSVVRLQGLPMWPPQQQPQMLPVPPDQRIMDHSALGPPMPLQPMSPHPMQQSWGVGGTMVPTSHSTMSFGVSAPPQQVANITPEQFGALIDEARASRELNEALFRSLTEWRENMASTSSSASAEHIAPPSTTGRGGSQQFAQTNLQFGGRAGFGRGGGGISAPPTVAPSSANTQPVGFRRGFRGPPGSVPVTQLRGRGFSVPPQQQPPQVTEVLGRGFANMGFGDSGATAGANQGNAQANAPPSRANAQSAPPTINVEMSDVMRRQWEAANDEDRHILTTEPKHLTEDQRKRRKQLYDIRNRQCMNCGVRGHGIDECKEPCGSCNGTDHKKTKCPNKPKKDDKSGGDDKGPPPPPPPKDGKDQSKRDGGSSGTGPSSSRGGSGGGRGGRGRGGGPSQRPPSRQPRDQQKKQGGNGGRNFSASRSQSRQPNHRSRLSSSASRKRDHATELSPHEPLKQSKVERACPTGFKYKPYKTSSRSSDWTTEGINYFIGYRCEMLALGILCEPKKDYGVDKKGRRKIVPLIMQFGFESGDRIGNISEGDIIKVKEYFYITSGPNSYFGFRNPSMSLANIVVDGVVVPDALAQTYQLETSSQIYRGKRILAAMDCTQNTGSGFISLEMNIAGELFEDGITANNAAISRTFDLSLPLCNIFVQADVSVATAGQFCVLGQMIIPADLAPELAPLYSDRPRINIVTPITMDSLDFIRGHGSIIGFLNKPVERNDAFEAIIKPALTATFCVEKLALIKEKRQAMVRVDVSEFRPEHETVFKVLSAPTNKSTILRHRLRYLKPVSDVELYAKDEDGQYSLGVCSMKTMAIALDNDDQIIELVCKRFTDLTSDTILSNEALQRHVQYNSPKNSDEAFWSDLKFPYKDLLVVPKLNDISMDCRLKFMRTMSFDMENRYMHQLIMLNLLSGVGAKRRTVYQKYMNPSKSFPDDFPEIKDMVAKLNAPADNEQMEIAHDMGDVPVGGDGAEQMEIAHDTGDVPAPPKDDGGVEVISDDSFHGPDNHGTPTSVKSDARIGAHTPEGSPNESSESSESEDSSGSSGSSSSSEDVPGRLVRQNISLIGKWPISVGGKSHENCIYLVDCIHSMEEMNAMQKIVLCDLIVDESPLVPIMAPPGTGKTKVLSEYTEILTFCDKAKFRNRNLLCVAETNGSVERMAEAILKKVEAVEKKKKRNTAFIPLRVLVLKSNFAEAQNEPDKIHETQASRSSQHDTSAHAEHILAYYNANMTENARGLLRQFVYIKKELPDVVFNEQRIVEMIILYNPKLRVIISTRALACTYEAVLQWTHRIAFDEASQIRHVDGLLMIAHIPNLMQVMMGGDGEQIGPFIPSSVENKFFGIGHTSLLNYVDFYTDLKRQFVETYRLSKPMAELLEKVIYKSGLVSRAEHGFLPYAFNLPVATDGYPVMLLHTTAKAVRLPSGSWTNNTQCEIASHLVRAIAKHGSEYAPSVAVICMYAGDAFALQMGLDAEFGNDDSLESLVVETVNSYMGNENDFTILVTGREWAERDVRGSDPFVMWPKQFTVAVSRARHLTTIIGNMNFLVSINGSRIEKFITEAALRAPPLNAEWYTSQLQIKRHDIEPTYHPDSGVLIAASGLESYVADCIPASVNGWRPKKTTRVPTPAARQ